MDTDEEIILLEKSEICKYHSNTLCDSNVGSPKGIQECYREIVYKNISYRNGDFVILKGSKFKEVGRIICFFINNLKFQAVVIKYMFAKYFESLFKVKSYEFDKNNEVIQDASKYYTIDLSNILKKCNLIILTHQEDPYYVSAANLNPANNFSCRFKIKSDTLYPILDENGTMKSESKKKSFTNAMKIRNQNLPLQSTSSEDENGAVGGVSKRTLVKRKKTAKQNQSANSENLPLNNEDSSDDETESQGVKSKRSIVKRNLNSSFAEVENYSIVLDDEQDPLTVKLRKSTSLKHLERRKSTRSVPRKSYADYQSPKKARKKSDDEDYVNSPNSSPTKKLLVEISNLKIESPTKEDESNALRRSQRRKRPVTYKDDDDNVMLPICTTPGKNIRNDSYYSPKKKANVRTIEKTPNQSKILDDQKIKNSTNTGLDDSLRTQILKVKLENIYFDDNTNNPMLPFDNKKISRTKLVTGLRSSSDDDDFSALPPQEFSVSPPTEESTPTSKRNRSTRTPNRSPKTPKTTRLPKTPKKTPRSTIKQIREGQITPSVPSRSSSTKPKRSPNMRIRQELHVSHVPTTLPCREQEYEDIYQFLKGKLNDGCGGCMYVSGVPGTGKTATVTSVILNLKKDKEIPKFTYVNVNAMGLTEPRQSYVEIVKQLTGKVLSWELAQSTLETMFLKSKSQKPIMMVIDELDILCTRRQDVVYNLLDWPSKAKTQLIVVTIANTMDLPERLLMSRVASRLGLTRLTFQAYTHKQLQEIIMKRLTGLVGFNPDAIQYVARKVASVSGDARRALDICRRAVELAEDGAGVPKVEMRHVSDALESMITQPKVQAIKFCSRLEQLILKSIVAEVERTGIEETTFSNVYRMFTSICAIDGFQMVSQTLALSAVARLGYYRLIITDPKCNDIRQRIVLNTSVDDVYFALQKRINPADIELEPLG